jgi:lipid A ethanolaminephosphotransferase
MFSFLRHSPHRPHLASVLALALWLTTLGNPALWQQLWALPEVGGLRGARFVLGMGLFLLGTLVATISLVAWPRLFKPVGVFLLLASAAATHFMLVYSAVIDSTMLLNVLHTDAKEAGDLMSLRFILTLVVLGLVPAIWLWRQPVPAMRWSRRLLSNLGLLAAGLLVAGLSLVWVFQDFASVMRNHKQVRYLFNPLNTVYGLGKAAADTLPKTQQTLQAIGTDVQLGSSHAQQPPPLLVVVVGETARAANFGLGGYARDTTPVLKTLMTQGPGLLTYYANVRSCGTNTQASVPCMFSHLGKADFEGSHERFENLLDVLQRAGLAVVWIDNQSGCKGLCERIPNTETRDLKVPGLCDQGDCLDEVMIPAMERELQALPAERRAKGTVVVLHQMGSHGPAYAKRAPASQKVFLPECTSNALQDCSREQVVNAYDNSIRYTDHFLGQTIAWLGRQAQSTALLYVSDHGESLGENNLYLHGLPYAIAPDTQKHVPMVTWLSPAMQQRLKLSASCLNQRATQPLSHDHLFHSVLGLMDLNTQVHQPALDVFATCKG